MREMIIDTEVHGISVESPLIYAQQLARLEPRGEITTEERAWLANNPLLWLRALYLIRADVLAVISRDKAKLRVILYEFGEKSPEHREARIAYDENLAKRRHFEKIIQRRIAELKVALGRELASASLVGEVVGSLLEAAVQIETDPEGARQSLLAYARHLRDTYDHDEAPDNSQASPVKLVLSSRYHGEFRCRACRRRTMPASAPTCPECGQRHELELMRD